MGVVATGRALVTGADGFIGRHLCATLRSSGNWSEVLVFQGDIREIADFATEVDIVFHLAARSRPGDFQEQAPDSFDVNVSGTLAVLLYCKRIGARCVFVSTSGVYAVPLPGERVSEDSPIDPAPGYALSKWIGERICLRCARELDLSIVILRLFNVYGPGQHPDFVVPYICDSLLRGEPITLRMPNAKRDFIYVSDVVTVMLQAASYPGRGAIFWNVGTGIATSIMDFLRVAERELGVIGQIRTENPEAGNRREKSEIIANPERIGRELGWTPRVDLTGGLRHMLGRTEEGTP